MSFDTNWSVEKYRDGHESEEHWELRRTFMERWKHDYPEDRVVCLARVFANMEFMGCRYPIEIMQEVARLSTDIVQEYRKTRKGKLQRTFVSASTAAEDRAKGVKRAGGIVMDCPSQKSAKINFVLQGQNENKEPDTENKLQNVIDHKNDENSLTNEIRSLENSDTIGYIKEMSEMQCLEVSRFNEGMFQTNFGKLVLLIRPWADKLTNIITSCNVCKILAKAKYEINCYSFTINGKLVGQATGSSKAEARSIVQKIVWNRLREEVISVIVKEQFIPHGDRVSHNDVSGRKAAEINFGTPIANSVATKMMQLMGWKGGGLGADSQGIEEPIKPNLQMVNRAGLGSSNITNEQQLSKAAHHLMQRYIASDTLDLDLVFTSDFSKEERAVLHLCAKKCGLVSRSYGDKDRFLVVKKKLNPFAIVRAVVQKGGVTAKYEVFLPIGLDRRREGR